MGTQNPGNQVYRAAGRLQFVKIGCAECDVGESGGTVIVCIAGKALKSRRILHGNTASGPDCPTHYLGVPSASCFHLQHVHAGRQPSKTEHFQWQASCVILRLFAGSVRMTEGGCHKIRGGLGLR